MYPASRTQLNIYLLAALTLLKLVTESGGVPLACNVNETSRNLQLPETHGQHFYYFGYGSNMLESRIHIQNPSAKLIGPALLMNYQLDFYGFTDRWLGAPATVVPSEHGETYGSLWNMNIKDMSQLDNQEGVHLGYYEAQSLPVTLMLNDSRIPTLELMARVYLLVEQPDKKLDTFTPDEVPEDRQPSKTYLQVLVKGAEETGLPSHYVDSLRNIKHNSRVVQDFQVSLDLQDVKVS